MKLVIRNLVDVYRPPARSPQHRVIWQPVSTSTLPSPIAMGDGLQVRELSECG